MAFSARPFLALYSLIISSQVRSPSSGWLPLVIIFRIIGPLNKGPVKSLWLLISALASRESDHFMI